MGCANRPFATSISIRISLSVGHDGNSCGKSRCSRCSWIHHEGTFQSRRLPRERWVVRQIEWQKRCCPVWMRKLDEVERLMEDANISLVPTWASPPLHSSSPSIKIAFSWLSFPVSLAPAAVQQSAIWIEIVFLLNNSVVVIEDPVFNNQEA